jgi:hypothetical protein
MKPIFFLKKNQCRVMKLKKKTSKKNDVPAIRAI